MYLFKLLEGVFHPKHPEYFNLIKPQITAGTRRCVSVFLFRFVSPNSPKSPDVSFLLGVFFSFKKRITVESEERSNFNPKSFKKQSHVLSWTPGVYSSGVFTPTAVSSRARRLQQLSAR